MTADVAGKPGERHVSGQLGGTADLGSEHTMIWAAATTTALVAIALAVRTRGRLFLTFADRDVE